MHHHDTKMALLHKQRKKYHRKSPYQKRSITQIQLLKYKKLKYQHIIVYKTTDFQYHDELDQD